MYIIKMLKYFVVISVLMISALNLQAQTDEIVDCIRKGNSKALAGYFNQNVELAVLATESRQSF